MRRDDQFDAPFQLELNYNRHAGLHVAVRCERNLLGRETMRSLGLLAVLLTACVCRADDPSIEGTVDPLVDIARERVNLFIRRLKTVEELGKLEIESSRLAITRAKTEIEAREAAREAASSQVELSSNELKRIEVLVENGAVDRSTLDRIRAQFAKATAELRSRSADLDRLKTEIDTAGLTLRRSELEFVLRQSEARLEMLEARMELERLKARAEQERRVRAVERDGAADGGGDTTEP